MSDAHGRFLAALDEYRTRWPAEAVTVARFLMLVERWPDPLARTALHPGHITASAWVVTPDGDAVLLTHHKKLDKWLQIGGHADGDPNLPAVAVREAHEESGAEGLRPALPRRGVIDPAWRVFDLDVHRIPSFRTTPPHEHYDVCFAYYAPEQFVPVVSDESHDVRWVRIAALDKYTRERSITRMAVKWRLLQRHATRVRPVG